MPLAISGGKLWLFQVISPSYSLLVGYTHQLTPTKGLQSLVLISKTLHLSLFDPRFT